MNKIKYIFILLIVSVLSNANTIDSLLIEINKETINYNIVALNMEIAEELLFYNPDSARTYINNALKLCEKENNDSLSINVYNTLGYSFELVGKLENAENAYIKVLEIALKSKNRLGEFTGNVSLGSINYYKGNYNEALRYYQIALEIAEERNDTFSIAQTYHNIGMVHDDVGNDERGLEYYKKALKVFFVMGDPEWLGVCHNSMASIFVEKKDYKKAKEFYNKAVDYFNDAEDPNGVGMVYANIGELYLKLNQIDRAEEQFLKSINISKSVNDIMAITSTYLNMADLLYQQNIFYRSIEYTKKSLYYSRKGEYLALQREAYALLKDNYFGLHNYKLAILYYDSLSLMTDSIFNKEKFESIEEMESKYQTVQNKLKIDNLEKDHALQNERIAKQNIYLYTFIFGFLIVLIFLIFIFRLFKANQKVNNDLKEHQYIILEKNEELNQLVEEVTAQKDEIEMQREKLIDINSDITQSIAYAEQIQNSILPKNEILEQIISDNFIFYKPKDIVSGDFYWFTKIENKLIITVVDCTGHGVPGAFMSMLGASLLREIIIKEKITEPDIILDNLRTEVVSALQQKGNIGEQKDGMDMALLTINLDTYEIQYAGANNPLYLITNYELQIINEESTNSVKLCDNSKLKIKNSKLLYEVKPDKMPISYFVRMNSFTTKTIQLQKGDSIYLFSDGYPDQFGGSKNRKFKYKPFKELLVNNVDKPMNEQKAILEESLANWQGNNSQVDDITIVGLKL